MEGLSLEKQSSRILGGCFNPVEKYYIVKLDHFPK